MKKVLVVVFVVVYYYYTTIRLFFQYADLINLTNEPNNFYASCTKTKKQAALCAFSGGLQGNSRYFIGRLSALPYKARQ